MMKKILRGGLSCLGGFFLILAVLCMALGSHYRLCLNPAKTLPMKDVVAVNVSVTDLDGCCSFDVHTKKATSPEEFSKFVELYNRMEKSTFGIQPEYIRTRSNGAALTPTKEELVKRIIYVTFLFENGDGVQISPYYFSEDGRYENVIEMRGSKGGKLIFSQEKGEGPVPWVYPSERVFFCDRETLMDFTEYAVSFVKTDENHED